MGTEEGLALNQQIWYAKVAYKPSVGETIVIAQKESDAGEPYVVNTVSLVDPTHVPNDLVVECVSPNAYCAWCFNFTWTHPGKDQPVLCFQCLNKLY